MPRLDRDVSGSTTQRVSQTEILKANSRDNDDGRSSKKPIAGENDDSWYAEASSSPLHVKLGDFLKRSSAH